jgi:hypothetical protein
MSDEQPITRGGDVLRQWRDMIDGVEVAVTIRSRDPICPRVSLGGRPGVGYYCVYRGDHAEVVDILERALAAVKRDGQA